MAGKILIIDDDRDITQIIRILLEGEGFETCTAYSGTQALASLDETVELIILDIMMDGMNGFEVCHRIREQLCPDPVSFGHVRRLGEGGGPDGRRR